MTTTLPQKNHLFRKFILIVVVTVIIFAGLMYAVFQLTPWPQALLIRYDFEKDAAATSEALAKYVPANIAEIRNQQYRQNDTNAYLDVYYPDTIKETETVLPTVVWVHGGGWVSGNKEQIANYLKILAAKGYTTVSVGYAIAPEHHFPRPVQELNDALYYLEQNAKRFHIDTEQIILAGDSAGAQIAAQMATIITNPKYAYLIGIAPSLAPEQVTGVVLACGAYDLSLVNLDGKYHNFLQTVLWAYSDEKDFLADPKFQLLSVINYIDKDYPPAFLTVGNDDPLESQSFAFAQALQKKGVRTQTLFYPADHEPKLPHEYQFNLDTTDGQKALTEIVNFLEEQTEAKE